MTAVGLLSAPHTPPFPGAEEFAGTVLHTSRWPEQPVDFHGKRVAVVGAGSSGIQVVPLIAEQAEHLTVFQRTPNYVVPIQNRALDTAEIEDVRDRITSIRDHVRQHPFAMRFVDPARNTLDVAPDERQRIFEEGWAQGGFHFLFETFSDLQLDARANEEACDFIRGKIRSIVRDAATAELLCPQGYAYGSASG